MGSSCQPPFLCLPFPSEEGLQAGIPMLPLNLKYQPHLGDKGIFDSSSSSLRWLDQGIAGNRERQVKGEKKD